MGGIRFNLSDLVDKWMDRYPWFRWSVRLAGVLLLAGWVGACVKMWQG